MIIGRGWKSKAIKAINIKLRQAALASVPVDEYGNINLSLYVNDLPPRKDGKVDCDYIIKPDGRSLPKVEEIFDDFPQTT